MKKAQLFPLILSLLFAGCARDRLIEVNASRIDVVSPLADGITPKLAEEVFREVANALGLVIEGPVRLGAGKYEFSAKAREKPPFNKTWLIMWVDQRHISFISRIHGPPKDLPAIEQAAGLFANALNKRGVQYKVTKRTGVNPLNN